MYRPQKHTLERTLILYKETKLVAVQQHVVTVYINNLNIFKLLLTVNGIVNLPYLRDFVPPQLGGRKCPHQYFLCSLSYVNKIWYVATMSKKDLKCGKNCNLFYNDVIMTSFPFQISEFPSLSSCCSKSNAKLPQKNDNSLIFMLNRSCLGMLQIIRVKIFFDTGLCHLKHVHLIKAIFSTFFHFCIVWVNSTKSAPTNFV